MEKSFFREHICHTFSYLCQNTPNKKRILIFHYDLTLFEQFRKHAQIFQTLIPRFVITYICAASCVYTEK